MPDKDDEIASQISEISNLADKKKNLPDIPAEIIENKQKTDFLLWKSVLFLDRF